MRRRRNSPVANFERLERRDCPAVVSIVGPQTVNENGGPITLMATLSQAQRTPVEVRYMAHGTAAIGADYRMAIGRTALSQSGVFRFAPGQTSLPITVTPVNDVLREGSESFTLALIAAQGHTLGSRTVTVTIQDDDNYTAQLIGPTQITPGSRGTFTLQLSSPATKAETFYVSTQDGTATSKDDYWPIKDFPVTFTSGQSAKSFTLGVRPNTSGEYDEAFAIRVRSKDSAIPVTPLRLVSIQGIGPRPLPILSVGDVTLAEGNSGSSFATFRVSLSQASASPVSVTYTTIDSTATVADKDYGAASGTLIFNPGETVKNVLVPVYGDTKAEPDETFSLVLSSATGASLANTVAVATIRNDDAAPIPTISISDVGVAEGNSGLSTAAFVITLSFANSSPVTVNYTTANGTATTADNDYVASSGTLTFAPGETQKVVPVGISGDTKQEPDETFLLVISSPTNATLGNTQATGTIWNDDYPTASGSWTIMVYMTGDDLNRYAHDDVNEMERALAMLPPSVNILVSWDQPRVTASGVTSVYSTGNGSQAPWNSYGRSKLIPDRNNYGGSGFDSVLSTFEIFPGDKNTGDPATLIDFVKWGATKAPAQKYALMMWGHGGGLVGSNEDVETPGPGLAGGDEITLNEMSQALNSSGMPRFDVVGYDSCLMGMLEVGYALSPALATGGAFVASQELEPGTGHNYATVFNALRNNPYAVSASQLAAGIVQSYQAAGNPPPADTYSASSAAAFASLAKSMRAFTDVALGSRNESLRLDMAKAVASTTFYGGIPNSGLTQPFGDLGGFMRNVSLSGAVSQAVRDSATAVLSSLQSTVFAKTADLRRSSGLSIYLRNDGIYDFRYTQDAPSFVSATQWDQFVRWVSLGI